MYVWPEIGTAYYNQGLHRATKYYLIYQFTVQILVSVNNHVLDVLAPWIK